MARNNLVPFIGQWTMNNEGKYPANTHTIAIVSSLSVYLFDCLATEGFDWSRVRCTVRIVRSTLSTTTTIADTRLKLSLFIVV